MKVIAIANYKGGVGKTITTHNVADGLAMRGQRVLMIDFDPQSNLTGCVLSPKQSEQLEITIPEAMTANVPGSVPLPIVHVKEHLDLVPSSLRHSGTENLISQRKDKFEILRILVSEVRSRYDFILIDCPPTPGTLTANALVAADRVIVPIEAQALPMKGISQIMKMIQIIKAQFNPSLSLGGILITRYKANNLSKITEGMLRQGFDCVFDTKISESVQIATAPAFFRSIFEHAPKSRGAAQFAALVDEFLAMK